MHKSIDKKEEERLRALREYNIIEEDADFNFLLEAVAAMCDMPLCSIVTAYKDNLEIIASTGIQTVKKLKREGSCSQFTLDSNTFCEIADIRNQEEIDYEMYLLENFAIIFYAGYPLIDPHGNSLGTLNLFDNKTRVLTQEQKKLIAKAASRIVKVFIDQRQKQRLLHFDKMFSKSKDLIGIIRYDGEIVEINSAFSKLLGYNLDDVYGENMLSFIHPIGLPEALSSLERLTTGVSEVNYTLPSTTKSNEIRWIEWTSTPDPATRLIYFIGRDITVVHEKTILLKNSEVRFRALFENSQSLICTHDLQGNFISMNRVGAEMMGCSVEEAQKMNIKDLYPVKKHPVVMAFLDKIYKNKTLSITPEIINKNGEKRMWLLNSVIEKNYEGEDYVISNGVDITNRYKMEEDLKIVTKKAEEANRAKSEFIANMSHEIRTPLNGIIGFTDLVQKTRLDNTQRQYLKIINQSGSTLLNIVDQILDFSKIESRKITLVKDKIDLQSLASDACSMVSFASEKKGLEMLLDFQEDLPRFIWADEIRLKQVLVNLLSNAVKFTNEGEIKLSIHLEEILPNDHIILHFTVCDTGVGIHPDKMDQIFKAFAQEDSSITKKYGGTGLGLTISNRLLELMESKLLVKSELKKGSSFSFKLKLKAKKQSFDDDLLKGINNVLVVDDNESNRQILKRMLELKNIQVDEADSGLAALLMLQKKATYDVIIMDYHMPVMDGIETIRKLKKDIVKSEKLEEQPIVMLYSSSDSLELQDECDKLEIQSRLVKPIKMQEMYEVLAQLKNENLKQRNANQASLNDNGECILPDENIVILIAEDNEINMYLTKILVHQMAPNCQIVEARDGEEAVALFFERRPDFVFMDIQMPKMNGLEATRQIRLREMGKPTPILALTAGNMSSEKEKCLEAGMNDFIAKPVMKEDLHEICKKWMKPRGPRTEEGEGEKKTSKSVEIEHLNKAWLQDYSADNSELKVELIRLAKLGIDESVEALKKAIVDKDLDAINATGHKLKGTSLAVGLTELSNLAFAFELLSDIKDESIGNLFESLLIEVAIVYELFKSEF